MSIPCKAIYRLSDASYPKQKLPGASKIRCLKNFTEVFGKDFLIIADRCTAPLLSHLKSENYQFIETDLGNAGSFRHALNLACDFSDDTVVYFVEDDYLHLADAPFKISDGIQSVDYLTVYDHPDKYGPMYDHGEITKVFRSSGTHWKLTTSTTMTFASQVKILKEDRPIWFSWTEQNHPQDHLAFTDLTTNRQRTLASAVPGSACHVDLTYSLELGVNTIEPWACEYIFSEIELNLLSQCSPKEHSLLRKNIRQVESNSKISLLEKLALLAHWEEQKTKTG